MRSLCHESCNKGEKVESLMLKDGWKHFMGGVKVCVRCTLLTTLYVSVLHSEASSWSPLFSSAAPLSSDSARHHEASLQCLQKKNKH